MLGNKGTTNKFIKNQISNMLNTLDVFENSCKLAAQQDDDYIDKNELAILKKLHKATEDYRKKLKSIKYDDSIQ